MKFEDLPQDCSLHNTIPAEMYRVDQGVEEMELCNRDGREYWIFPEENVKLHEQMKDEAKTGENDCILHLGEIDRWECPKCGEEVRARIPPMRCTSQICEGKRKTAWIGNMAPKCTFPKTKFPEESSLLNILDNLKNIIDDCLIIEPPYDTIMALWVIGTWKFHYWDTYPYLFFTGEIASGKSTALKVLREICYRGYMTASATPAVVARLIDETHATLLMDQAEDSFNRKIPGGADMYSIWMNGYMKDQIYLRARQGDDNGFVEKNVYSPKAYAATKVFDAALASRSIMIRMYRGNPIVKDISRMKTAFENLRSNLLYFHFSKSNLEIPDISLTGRNRELWMPLLILAKNTYQNYDELLKIAEKGEEDLREDLSQSPKGIVINTAWEIFFGRLEEKTMVSYRDFKDEAGVDDWTNRYLGAIFKDLGLTRVRRGNGYYLVLDIKTENILKKMKERY